MINAFFFLNSKKEIWGFEISGHAGYEEEGKDIICAAVSALAQNAANSIESFADEVPVIEQKDGYFSCCISSLKEENPNDKASLLLNSLKLGLTEIQKSYGKAYLKVKSNYRA